MEQLEKDRAEQERKLKKMEQEMEQVFEMKVKEKKKKLKDSEGEVFNLQCRIFQWFTLIIPCSVWEILYGVYWFIQKRQFTIGL